MNVINLRPQAPDGLPPSAEFDTVEEWLAAMPPSTLMLWRPDENSAWRLALVEDLIDAFAITKMLEGSAAFRDLPKTLRELVG